jgi:hypothetical protein
MLMVIFGAGASYDSAPEIPDPQQDVRRPPLASQLFDMRFGDVLDGNPDCVGAIQALRDAGRPGVGVSVETRLQQMLDDSPKRPHVARQLFALRAYLQQVIRSATATWRPAHSGETSYAILLSQIAYWAGDTDESVVLVTFNYDTMVDGPAHSILGINTGNPDGFVEADGAKLIRVHGSVNWDHKLEGVPPFKMPIDFLDTLVWTSQYRSAVFPTVDEDGAHWVPAIAIPTLRKVGFECPQSHVDALAAAMREVTYLVVIGWAAAEEHFFTFWRDSAPQAVGQRSFPSNLVDIHVVDRTVESAHDVAQRLQMNLRPVFEPTLHAGFAQFVREDKLRPLLGRHRR